VGACPKAKLTLKSRLVPVLVGLLIVLQLTFPYRGWLMLLVVVGGLWTLCFFWARALRDGLSLQREMRFGWTQVGDHLEERFTLTNNSNAPAVWVEIEDLSDMPDYDTSRGTGISGVSSNEWRTQGVCSHRGVYTLGPTRIITGDPFGLYQVSQDVASTQSLMVLPPIIPLPNIEVAPGGRVGEGRPQPNAIERTVSVSGVREYVIGDSVRWIHWPTTAHRQSLYVRQFESTPSSDWWIVLDVNEQVHTGEGNQSTLEHSVTLAASLADQGLRDGRSVGLIAYGDELVWLPPAASDEQRWSILRAMAVLDAGKMDLAELMERMRPAMGQRASVIVITPVVDERWVQTLTLMMRRGAAPTVLLLNANAGSGHATQADPEAVLALLRNLGIACYVIGPEVFVQPEATPGHQGEWNWVELPNGRVIPIKQMQNDAWRPLS
jgi:uncharacterized protein (DUF58 family)